MYTTKLVTEYHTVLLNHADHAEIHSGSTAGWRMITNRTQEIAPSCGDSRARICVYYNPYDILSNTPI